MRIFPGNTGHRLDLTQALLLALIQGITEFLPISSSAHLILPSKVFGWPDQGLAFDTAVHFGSLIAVVIYFRRDLTSLIQSLGHHFHAPSAESRLAINLIIATLPIIPVGYLGRFYIEDSLRSVEVIAFTTIFFGLILLVADYLGRRNSDETELTLRGALAIGLAQCLALVPGTSRSGITMTMAMLVGHSRTSAARISFLLAIPVIAGAAAVKLVDLLADPVAPNWLLLGVGTTMSGISAYLCIALLMKFVARVGYLPFVIYRLVLGSWLYYLIA